MQNPFGPKMKMSFVCNLSTIDNSKHKQRGLYKYSPGPMVCPFSPPQNEKNAKSRTNLQNQMKPKQCTSEPDGRWTKNRNRTICSVADMSFFVAGTTPKFQATIEKLNIVTLLRIAKLCVSFASNTLPTCFYYSASTTIFLVHPRYVVTS